MKGTATIKYDFDAEQWTAVLDSNPDVYGHGDTPADAVANLEFIANKHALWGS